MLTTGDLDGNGRDEIVTYGPIGMGPSQIAAQLYATGLDREEQPMRLGSPPVLGDNLAISIVSHHYDMV